MRSLRIALLAAAALLVTVPAANADTNVSFDGEETLTIEGSGSDANGVVVFETGGQLRVERATSAPFAPVNYTGGSGCIEAMAGPDVAVVCDAGTTGSLTVINANLGGGDDLLDSSALTEFGPFDPEHTMYDGGYSALYVDLGPGDDGFSGGPLSEFVRDGIGSDVVSAGAGTNYLLQPDVTDPELVDSHDVLDPGSGVSTVTYYERPADGVTASLDGVANDGAPGEDDNIAVTTYELEGTFFDDTLIGSDTNQKIESGPGDDVIDGRGGDDNLYAAEGNDSVTGGAGNDLLEGHEGNDVLYAADGENDNLVTCDSGLDVVTVDARPLDANVEPSPDGCETINRPGGTGGTPVVTTPVTPAPDTPARVAPKLTAPRDAKVATDGSGVARLAFVCKGVPCAAKKLVLKAKVGKRTVTIVVRVPALAAGEKTTVKVKLSSALAKAIRRAGKRGVKVKLSGLTTKPLALTLVKKR